MSKLNSIWKKVSERPYPLIAGIILSIFIISANLAWLNPNPDYVVKTNPRVPILWQYNGDATVEFLSAAYFPQYFKVDKTRTNRPAYPFVAKVLGETYGLIALPFHELNPLQKGLLGYMTMKFLVYLSAALALYSIAKRWFSKEVALLSVPLLLFHPFAVVYSGTFHTSELQFITPIFLVAMWLNLADHYSHKKNIAFSVLAGLLMLAKQNYAGYLAILAFSFLYSRKYKETILSFAAHLIPLGIWLISLKLLHIPYYNHEATVYGDGLWIFTDLLTKNIFEIIKTLASFTTEWMLAITKYFTISIFSALLAFSLPGVREKVSRAWIVFALILLGTNWLQFLAAKSFAAYLSSDIAVLVFPLAAYSIYTLFDTYGLRKAIPLFLALYLFVGLTTIIKFPWVHPYDQNDITHPDRVKLLEEGQLIPRSEP